MKKLAVATLPDETLARSPPEPIPRELADRIARMCLLITLADAHNARRVLPAESCRPWEARSAIERAAMSAGAARVVQALILLGLIES